MAEFRAVAKALAGQDDAVKRLLEDLAAGSVKANAAGKVAKVFDQYVDFVSLAEDIFSLAQKDAYVALNDPTAKDAYWQNFSGGLYTVDHCVEDKTRGKNYPGLEATPGPKITVKLNIQAE